MSGKHRDLLFLSRRRCFACKSNRWGLGPTETCNSSPKVVVLHAQNHKWRLGPIETSNSDARYAVLFAENHTWGLEPIDTSANDAVFHAQNERWGLVPLETSRSGPKVSVLQAKTTDEGWNQERLVILMLGTLFCMKNITSEVCDP